MRSAISFSNSSDEYIPVKVPIKIFDVLVPSVPIGISRDSHGLSISADSELFTVAFASQRILKNRVSNDKRINIHSHFLRFLQKSLVKTAFLPFNSDKIDGL